MKNKRWPWVGAVALVVIALVAWAGVSHHASKPTTVAAAASPSSTSTSTTTSTTSTTTSVPVAAPDPVHSWSVTAEAVHSQSGPTQITIDEVAVREDGERTALAQRIEEAIRGNLEQARTMQSPR